MTGNGLKTQEAVLAHLRERPVIEAELAAFDVLLSEMNSDPGQRR